MRKQILILLLLLTGCYHKVTVKAASPADGSPPVDLADLAYREGLSAFRLATPESYHRAVQSFRQATELKKNNCEYALHLAESLYFLSQLQRLNWEDYSEGVGEADAVLEFNRGSPECMNYQSFVLRLTALSMTFAGQRAVDIAAKIRKAIEIDPEDPMNWVVLSQANPNPGRDEQVAPIERAVALAADLPLVQYELGNFYLRREDTYGKAQAAFERALELSPHHFQSIIGIVYSLSPEGDDAADRVEKLLRKAADIAPSSLKARTLLGDYYAGLEETEKALEQYNAAIANNAKYYPAHLSEGTTLVTADRSRDAEGSFQAVIGLEVRKPHPPFNGVDFTADAQAHYYLGNIWLERGDLTKARSEYEQSVSDIANYAGPIYGLGIVSYREGKVDEALRRLDEVIQLNPSQFPNAYLARGGIRAERRQFTEALADFESAIRIYRQQVGALENKAVTDEAKGFTRRAESERHRKGLIEDALAKALESKKAVEGFAGNRRPI